MRTAELQRGYDNSRVIQRIYQPMRAVSIVLPDSDQYSVQLFGVPDF